VDGVALPNAGAMTVHLAAHHSVHLLYGVGRAIYLIDLARALDRSGIEPLMFALRDAGIGTHARFVYPMIAFAARETRSEICHEAEALLAPFVPEAMRRWTASASLYNVSWSGRQNRSGFDRSAVWSCAPLDRARLLSYTLLPFPSWIADLDDGLGGLPSYPRRYARHYYQLLRRII
jgi:hypothetical protein